MRRKADWAQHTVLCVLRHILYVCCHRVLDSVLSRWRGTCVRFMCRNEVRRELQRVHQSYEGTCKTSCYVY
jgi:hypothetical protein